MFQDLRLTHMLALTKNPETPPIILETLWREIKANKVPSLSREEILELRLNITRNPAANEYILSEAINEHHELFLNAISHPKINPTYLVSLLDYKNPETTKTVLGRPDLPLAVRYKILKQGEVWEQAILASRYDLTPEEASNLLSLVSLVGTTHPDAPAALDVACALAANPLIGDFDNTLSEKVWTSLADYNLPEINAALFKNPALPPHLLERLYNQQDPQQFRTLASIVTLPSSILESIATYAIANQDENILLALAGNASIPPSVSQALISTEKREIIKVLALSTEDLATRQALAAYPDPEISAIARDVPTLAETLRGNWSLEGTARALEISPMGMNDIERLNSVNVSGVFSDPIVTRFAIEHFSTDAEKLAFYREAINEIVFLEELGLANTYLVNVTINKVLANTQASLQKPGFITATEAPKTSELKIKF